MRVCVAYGPRYAAVDSPRCLFTLPLLPSAPGAEPVAQPGGLAGLKDGDLREEFHPAAWQKVRRLRSPNKPPGLRE